MIGRSDTVYGRKKTRTEHICPRSFSKNTAQICGLRRSDPGDQAISRGKAPAGTYGIIIVTVLEFFMVPASFHKIVTPS